MRYPGLWTDVEPLADLLELARSLGVPVPSRVGGPLVDVLIPRAPHQAPEQRSMSRQFGSGRFPPHTDGAYISQCPRWMLLRAVDVSSDAPPTELWPVVRTALDPMDLEVLERPLWSVHGRRPFLSPIFESQSNGDVRVRFDSCCMTPRTPNAARVQVRFVEAVTERSAQLVDWTPGRTIALDNWRVLHARPDCCAASRRVLERVLVAERDGAD